MGPWAGRSQRHDKLLELIEPPLAVVDFTDSTCWLQSSCSRMWRQAVPSVLDEARASRRSSSVAVDGLAAFGRWPLRSRAWHDPQATREVTASDKWGMTAHSSGATLVAHLNASRARCESAICAATTASPTCLSAQTAARVCSGSCSTDMARKGVASQRFIPQPTLAAERLHLRKLDAATDQGRVVECNAQALASDVHAAARCDFELHDLWYQDLVIFVGVITLDHVARGSSFALVVLHARTRDKARST